MFDRALDCLVSAGASARPLYAVRPEGRAGWLATLPPGQSGYVEASGFAAKAGELLLLPGEGGVAGAVLGLGADRSPFVFGHLPFGLPAETAWSLIPGDYDIGAAVLGFCLGAYRYEAFRKAPRAPAKLLPPEGDEVVAALRSAGATWMVRDLINAPANVLTPRALAEQAAALAARHGAELSLIDGAALEERYPVVAAVGRGSVQAPVVAMFHWRGPGAADNAPLLSLVGKGVCFDTGGYDLKPSAGMLRMKKDMGGAATVLGAARIIMESGLPIRLAVRIGCVENSVSGQAMRPSDILRSRQGLTIEVGNTDAEGRLVLCDLLAESCAEAPALLVDCATLTGAARVATGPDLPAFFCNDDTWAERFARGATLSHDPVWRLPLFSGYDPWLSSAIADVNNISGKAYAGAIVAALFLQRFVTREIPWVHVDLYAWNDTHRPGRPEGGEAQAMRAISSAADLLAAVAAAKSDG
jgi:leucyl aminopeptidase